MEVYERLADRLGDGFPDVTFSAFPDGSLDHFCGVYDGDERVRERDAFAAAVAAGRDSFAVRRRRTELGGQAVNAARQAHALAVDVTLLGHLDDDRFSLPFRTASMGRPSEVTVLSFASDDLMLATESPDVREWTFADLRAAAPDGVEAFLGRDAVWCGNWATMPNQTEALRAISAVGVDPGVFVFDPGPMAGASDRRVEGLVDALAELAGRLPVVVSVNGEEAGRLAAAVGGDGDRSGRLRELREETGVVAVEHEVDAALAATAEGVVRVPNLATEGVVSDTGGGDRFGAGLALARAAGWDWSLALALGNACASHYVGTGETGDAAALADHAANGERDAE